MEIQLHARGLYRVTMDTKEEPASVTDKARFLNKKDEAFIRGNLRSKMGLLRKMIK